MKKSKLNLVLIAALGCGLGAGALSLQLLRSASAAEPQPQAAVTTRIIVATRSLAPGEALGDADLRHASWPSESLPQGYVADAGDLLGRVVTVPVAAGQPVLRAAVASVGVGLPAAIPAGMRAVSIRIDDVSGVAGFATPGTRVDVLVTVAPAHDEVEPTTRILLQAVEVLAVGKETRPSAEGAPVESTVATLLVDPAGAERLVLGANQGKLQLALRGSADRQAVETPGARQRSLVGTDPASVRPAPAAEPTRRAATTPRTVEVLSGSRRAVVTF